MEPMAKRTSPARKLLLAPAVAIVLAGGFYVVSRNVPTGGLVAIGVGVAWVAAAGAVFLFLVRRDRVARLVVVGTALVVAVVGGYLIRPQPNEVDEDIVTAAPVNSAESQAPERSPAPRRNVQLLRGTFTGESGHSGKGTAAVVELARGGRVLTFSRFDVDPGAGRLRVYLTAGVPGGDGDVKDFMDLAPLKGTKGDQQYELPRGLDLERYGSVVIWCTPFTTRIAQAPLM